jgi:bifunctional DNA-binding transcriptional regulator/antitoxin component of YhaV-PrlF toxin-antitoxin module
MAITFVAKVDSKDEGVFIRVPDEVLRRLSAKRRRPVQVTVNGFTFRSTHAIYAGKAYLWLRREIRQAADIAAGDVLRVTLELDKEPRTVEMPPELAAELARAALSYTNRKEYSTWVAGARKPETRRRRAKEAGPLLEEGIRTPR